jgi:hypothetical protein
MLTTLKGILLLWNQHLLFHVSICLRVQLCSFLSYVGRVLVCWEQKCFLMSEVNVAVGCYCEFCFDVKLQFRMLYIHGSNPEPGWWRSHFYVSLSPVVAVYADTNVYYIGRDCLNEI